MKEVNKLFFIKNFNINTTLFTVTVAILFKLEKKNKIQVISHKIIDKFSPFVPDMTEDLEIDPSIIYSTCGNPASLDIGYSYGFGTIDHVLFRIADSLRCDIVETESESVANLYFEAVNNVYNRDEIFLV